MPSRAVDGNIDGIWGHRSVTYTGTLKDSWWEVDLQGSYPIYLVLVHNRRDCCQERIDGAIVKVDDHVCGTIHVLPGIEVYPVNCNGAKGSTVRIEQPNNYLSLAEVQVFGKGGPGPLGRNIGSGSYAKLLSQNKYAHQSSEAHGGQAMRAVDGNTDGVWGHGSVTHSGKPNNNWWQVELYQDYRINLVIVYNRREAPNRIDGTEVYAGKQKCGTIFYNPKKTHYMIRCDGRTGDHVRIVNKKHWLQLAEVQVFGGSKGVTGLRLISKGKPTKASSVGWGAVPGKAVDGNVDGVWGHKTSYCSAKGKKDNWWQVDLEGNYPVYMVLVHNRVDKCCSARINGAKVTLDN